MTKENRRGVGWGGGVGGRLLVLWVSGVEDGVKGSEDVHCLRVGRGRYNSPNQGAHCRVKKLSCPLSQCSAQEKFIHLIFKV